jgi:hypothetical protein
MGSLEHWTQWIHISILLARHIARLIIPRSWVDVIETLNASLTSTTLVLRILGSEGLVETSYLSSIKLVTIPFIHFALLLVPLFQGFGFWSGSTTMYKCRSVHTFSWSVSR